MAELKVLSEVTGSVWKILVAVGDSVTLDTPVACVESMKMEIPVLAPDDGVVVEIVVQEGQKVSEGDLIMTLRA
jgi:acetyl-CoA carboxylase biotin carboxyl carrier protein